MSVERRQVLLLAGVAALGLMPWPANAAITEKTIDRRVRSEARQYGLTFAAEAPGDDSESGHAFIVWQHEDDDANMSAFTALGFYATGQLDFYNLIIGTDGTLLDDSKTKIDEKLTVLLNSDQYQLALDARDAWEADGTYQVFWHNCTTHVAAIAQAIGLKTSSGTWQKPLDYVNDLIANND